MPSDSGVISKEEAVKRAVLIMLPRLEYGSLQEVANDAGMTRYDLYYLASKELQRLGRGKRKAPGLTSKGRSSELGAQDAEARKGLKRTPGVGADGSPSLFEEAQENGT